MEVELASEPEPAPGLFGGFAPAAAPAAAPEAAAAPAAAPDRHHHHHHHHHHDHHIDDLTADGRTELDAALDAIAANGFRPTAADLVAEHAAGGDALLHRVVAAAFLAAPPPAPPLQVMTRWSSFNSANTRVSSVEGAPARVMWREHVEEDVKPAEEPPPRVATCTLDDVRATVEPIALALADTFGFQQGHPLKTDAKSMEAGERGDLVPGSVANQIEHIALLLKNMIDRQAVAGSAGSFDAFFAAVAQLHDKSLANYLRWLRHVGLDGKAEAFDDEHATLGTLTQYASDPSALFRFETAEEEMRWLCHAQLHQLVLWFLIWGEGANMRHLPELLCLVFHCAAFAAKLPTLAQGVAAADGPWVRGEASRLYSDQRLPEGDFLASIVQPVYLFVAHEVFGRREEKITDRVMYDDVNESMWFVDRLRLLMPKTVESKDMYAHLRRTLRDAGAVGKAPKGELSKYFRKTYSELTTWLVLWHLYYRVFMLLLVVLHLSIAIHTWGVEALPLLSCVVTHSLCKLLRVVSDFVVGHPPRNADSPTSADHVGNYHLRVMHFFNVAAYLLVPVISAVEATVPAKTWFGSVYASLEDQTLLMWVWGAYAVAHVAALLVGTRPGRTLRSFIRRPVKPFVGASDQMAVPWSSWIVYTLFWCFVLAVKFTFGHYVLVGATGPSIRALWNYDDQCWVGPPTEAFTYCGQRKVVDPSTDPVARAVLVRAYTLLLIAMRLAVPFCVWFFDLAIWYSLSAACISISCAVYKRIGRVSSWSQLLRSFDLTVVLFYEKLVHEAEDDLIGEGGAVIRKQPKPAASWWNVPALLSRIAHVGDYSAPVWDDGVADDEYAPEPRSRQWQLFGRAWNEIVHTLRGYDLVSDAELGDLLFRFIGGTSARAFFGVGEYVLYPPMLSSPVYTSRVVHGSFTSTYPHFHRALRQLRDVLCFLLVQVGVVDAAQARELVQVLTRLARTAGKLRSQRRQGDAGGLDALRSATISLLTTLNDLRLEELSMRGMTAPVDEVPTSPMKEFPAYAAPPSGSSPDSIPSGDLPPVNARLADGPPPDALAPFSVRPRLQRGKLSTEAATSSARSTKTEAAGSGKLGVLSAPSGGSPKPLSERSARPKVSFSSTSLRSRSTSRRRQSLQWCAPAAPPVRMTAFRMAVSRPRVVRSTRGSRGTTCAASKRRLRRRDRSGSSPSCPQAAPAAGGGAHARSSRSPRSKSRGAARAASRRRSSPTPRSSTRRADRWRRRGLSTPG